MRRIAIINQKGGVGKTTTVANLGAALARLGRRVVVIDLDPQANLSLHLDVPVEQNQPSIYTVLIGETQLAAALRPTRTPNLSIVSSNIDLSGAELELASAIGRESLLRDALEAWEREAREKDGRAPADYVLIDCPPSLGLLSINGLVAAGETIVTLQTEFFALQGMSKLVDVLKLLKKRLNPTLEIAGILPCMYDSRLKLAREVLAEIKNYFPGRVFGRAIGKNVKLAEAPSYGRTIFEYAPECSGSSDYQELAVELCAQEARDAELVTLARPATGSEKSSSVSPAPSGAKSAAPMARRERKQPPAPATEPSAPSAAANSSPRPEELRNVDIVPPAPRAAPAQHGANEREPSHGEAPDAARAANVEPAPAPELESLDAVAAGREETLREIELVPAGPVVAVITASAPPRVASSSTLPLAVPARTDVTPPTVHDQVAASSADAFACSASPSATALVEPESAVFENRLASYGFGAAPTLEPVAPGETGAPNATAEPEPASARATDAPAATCTRADDEANARAAEIVADELPELPSDALLLEDEPSNG
ncbi:MAG: AAA family ATPase [Planctomycetes bacterium]|nr:AAA family ATPase [Planctomycetota bacterium]